jgi:hypothetical protein
VRAGTLERKTSCLEQLYGTARHARSTIYGAYLLRAASSHRGVWIFLFLCLKCARHACGERLCRGPVEPRTVRNCSNVSECAQSAVPPCLRR